MIFGISAFNYLLSAEFQLKSEGTVGSLPSLDVFYAPRPRRPRTVVTEEMIDAVRLLKERSNMCLSKDDIHPRRIR